MTHTPCQDGPPDRWFPPSGLDPKQVAALKAECATCPILESCKEWGIVHAEVGIWGGTTDGERAKIRRHRGITPQRIVMSLDAERDAMVRGMVQRGHSTGDIAAALGVTHSAAEQARLRVQRNAS